MSCIHTVRNRLKNSDTRLTYCLQINDIYRIPTDRTNFPKHLCLNINIIASSLELTFATTRVQHMMVKAQITRPSQKYFRNVPNLPIFQTVNTYITRSECASYEAHGIATTAYYCQYDYG